MNEDTAFPDSQRDEDVPSGSVARLVESVAPEEDSPRRMQLWGRVWGTRSDLALAIYWVIDPDEETIVDLTVVTHGKVAGRSRFDPTDSPASFYNTLKQTLLSQDRVPRGLIEQYREIIRQYFEEHCDVDSLRKTFEALNDASFVDWAEDFSRHVHEDEVTRYHLQGRLVPESHLEDAREHQPGDAPGDSAMDPPVESEPRVSVTLVDDPVHGKRVEELEKGGEVVVRLTGDIVDHLSEEHLDRDRDPVESIPLTATVQSVTPFHRPSQSGNLRRVVVKLNREVRGEATEFSYRRVRVRRTDSAGDDDDLAPTTSNVLYWLLGGLVLGQLGFLLWLLW